jgi:hypothetical protein
MSKGLVGAAVLAVAGVGFTLMTAGILGMAGVAALGVPAGIGLTSLGTGLTAMTGGLVGAGVLAASALGFMAMTLGIPGMLGVSVLGASAGVGLTALAGGLTAMTAGLLGSAALVAAGVGFSLMTLGIPGMIAVSLLGAPASIGLSALAVGLTAFGGAAMNPLVWLGVGLLGALGLSLIPMAGALAIASPAISAFGDVVKGAFQGIASIVTAAANGLVSIMNVITLEKATSMLVFSGSLVALGVASLMALPGIIALGVFSPVLIGLMSALTAASPAITAFGGAIQSAFGGIATIISSVSQGLVSMLSVITLEKAGAMLALAGSLPLLAAGIGTLALAAALGGGKVNSFIQGIAESASLLGGGNSLMTTAQAMVSMGSALAQVNEQIDRLNVEKLEKLEDFSVSLSVGGAITTIGNAVGGMVDAISAVVTGDDKEGVSQEPKENPLLNEIRGLRGDLTAGKVAVYMDSELVSRKVRSTFDKAGKNRMGSLNDSTGG